MLLVIIQANVISNYLWGDSCIIPGLPALMLPTFSISRLYDNCKIDLKLSLWGRRRLQRCSAEYTIDRKTVQFIAVCLCEFLCTLEEEGGGD